MHYTIIRKGWPLSRLLLQYVLSICEARAGIYSGGVVPFIWVVVSRSSVFAIEEYQRDDLNPGLVPLYGNNSTD